MRARVILALVAVAGAGCGVEHRSPAYGQAYRESMAMQAKPPVSPPAPTNMALDTQEAEVISGTYVRGLAGKNRQDAPAEPVLYVAPAQRQAAPQPLPPSVPRD